MSLISSIYYSKPLKRYNTIFIGNIKKILENTISPSKMWYISVKSDKNTAGQSVHISNFDILQVCERQNKC